MLDLDPGYRGNEVKGHFRYFTAVTFPVAAWTARDAHVRVSNGFNLGNKLETRLATKISE
jgi:hypothetical protein